MQKIFFSTITWIIFFLILSAVGFAEAVYLTVTHYMGGLPTCTVVEGCDIVAMSEYATIGPIPVSLLGVVFYTLMLVWGVIWLDTRNRELFRYLPLITVPAFFFSIRLVYLMYYVIEAICIYCIISSILTTLIMLLSLLFRNRLRPGLATVNKNT